MAIPRKKKKVNYFPHRELMTIPVTYLVCVANGSIQSIYICDQKDRKKQKHSIDRTKVRRDDLDATNTGTALPEEVDVLHRSGFIAGVLLPRGIGRDFSNQRHCRT